MKAPCPYGHEVHRRRAVRLRVLPVAFTVLLLSAGYIAYLGQGIDQDSDVQLFSPTGGTGSTTLMDRLEPGFLATLSPEVVSALEALDKGTAPGGGVDVRLNPGGTMLAEFESISRQQRDADAADEPSRSDTVVLIVDTSGQAASLSAIRWDNLAAPLVPLAALILAGWAAAPRITGIHARLNYGVYKGPMPLELHGAQTWKRIHRLDTTHKAVYRRTPGAQPLESPDARNGRAPPGPMVPPPAIAKAIAEATATLWYGPPTLRFRQARRPPRRTPGGPSQRPSRRPPQGPPRRHP